jgi:hypothetical protein
MLFSLCHVALTASRQFSPRGHIEVEGNELGSPSKVCESSTKVISGAVQDFVGQDLKLLLQ